MCRVYFAYVVANDSRRVVTVVVFHSKIFILPSIRDTRIFGSNGDTESDN